MSKSKQLISVLLLSACGGSNNNFTVNLSGASEYPANNSVATGTAQFQISSDQSTITYSVTTSGIQSPQMGAQLLYGASGQNGLTIATLTQTSQSTFSGTITSSTFMPSSTITSMASLVSAMQAGQLYVNILDSQYPSGEIRGQIP